MNDTTALLARLYRYGSTLIIVLIILFAAKAIGEIRLLPYVGRDVASTRTITVTGTGVAYAKADIAELSLGVTIQAADVATAEEKATAAGNKLIAFLKEAGVAADDITTTNYSVSPRYSSLRCLTMPCPMGNGQIVGYDVSENFQVKIRDLAKAGAIVAGASRAGANTVSGLSFVIEDESTVRASARQQAIAKAEAEAKRLAADLGVHVGRLVGFNEDGGLYYAKTMSMMERAAGDVAAPTPELPTGQNQVSSTVHLVYEIR